MLEEKLVSYDWHSPPSASGVIDPHVHVTDELGNPLAGAQVHVASPGLFGGILGGGYFADATTGVDGNAEFSIPWFTIVDHTQADVIVNYTDPRTGQKSSGRGTWSIDLFWVAPDPLNIALTLPTSTDIPPGETTPKPTGLGGLLGKIPLPVYLLVGAGLVLYIAGPERSYQGARVAYERGREYGGRTLERGREYAGRGLEYAGGRLRRTTTVEEEE